MSQKQVRINKLMDARKRVHDHYMQEGGLSPTDNMVCETLMHLIDIMAAKEENEPTPAPTGSETT